MYPDVQRYTGIFHQCLKASIDEVKLGTLHEALPEVLVVRLEEADDATRLEHGKPGLR
jgi:hypothetical protein